MTRLRPHPVLLPVLLVLAMPVAGPRCQARKDAEAARVAETYAAFARIASVLLREVGAESADAPREDFGTEIVALRKLVAKCDKLDSTFFECLELAVADRVLAAHADPEVKRVSKTDCDAIAAQLIKEINYPNAPDPTHLTVGLHNSSGVDRYKSPEAIWAWRAEQVAELWAKRLLKVRERYLPSAPVEGSPVALELVAGQGLTLTNVSGRELTNVTLQVASRLGAEGVELPAAHAFLDRWKPEQAFVLPEEFAAGALALADLDSPHVELAVWSDELSHGPTRYEWDAKRYAGIREARPSRFQLDLDPEQVAPQATEADEMVGDAAPAEAVAAGEGGEVAGDAGEDPVASPRASDDDLQLVLVAQQLGNHSEAVQSLTNLQRRHSEDAAVLLLLGEALGSYGSRQNPRSAQSLLEQVRDRLSQSSTLAEETLERLGDAGFRVPQDVPGLLIRVGRDLQAIARRESLEWFIDRQKLDNRLGQIKRDIERKRADIEERRADLPKLREDLERAEQALQREIERQRRRVGIKDIGDERTLVGTCRRKLSQAEARVAEVEEELGALLEEERGLEALAERLGDR